MIGVETRASGISNLGAKVRKGVKKWQRDGAAKGFAVAQENTPEDRGQLRQSAFQPTERGDSVVWGYSGASYAAPQEFGTDPFWPPAKPLVEWAERVAGDPSLGYAVQAKIAKEGIEEKRFIRDGADAQREWYRNNDVRRYIDRELE